ncbi:hypothetical protein [Paludibacterium denitrificans]|uniref:DUF1835 domain-containing protein n=1 Tax=Paludibacterium denitrificans TaxID=2675226 RepID=A0A844GEN2_9NEIS|nr:hypothetical protein [Paludibacterium denitrificans]MTD33005.1 hypothetical protein [Paludibacterium denitrificans]
MTAFGQPLLVLAAAVDVPTPLPDGCECLVLHEDFSIGPLQDADAIDAQWRTSWWNQLHWAQRWQPDADERWLHDYWRARKRLLQALAARQTLWVRQPQSAGDWLLLAMLAEQQHAPAQLYLLDPATAQPRLLAPDERTVLISGWQYWRQHADGLRRWQDGVVVELLTNALDHAVLAALLKHRGKCRCHSWLPHCSRIGKRCCLPPGWRGACSSWPLPGSWRAVTRMWRRCHGWHAARPWRSASNRALPRRAVAARRWCRIGVFMLQMSRHEC